MLVPRSITDVLFGCLWLARMNRIKCCAFILSLIVGLPPAVASPGDTELISIRRPDIPQLSGNKGSMRPAISETGRYVAFVSEASDLVPGDTNQAADVFVYDRTAGTMERVSVATDGTQARDASEEVSISANGQFVAFASFAPNLVPGDDNDGPDVFVHNRLTHTTVRISRGSNEDNFFDRTSISADGRFVAFSQFDEGTVSADLFVWDRQTGITTRVEVNVELHSVIGAPVISANGRFVAFTSDDPNLVPNDTNQNKDVFIHDLQTHATTRVSVSSEGVASNSESYGAALSSDGRFVAFSSSGTNLVPNDTNASVDIFMRDRTAGTTTRVSLSTGGTQANLHSSDASISADGKVVAFISTASNLVSGDTNGSTNPIAPVYDVFVRDLVTGETKRVNVSTASAQANADSGSPAISANGAYVAFDSRAFNLVANDRNANSDIFVRDRSSSSTTLASVAGVISRTPSGASTTTTRFAGNSDNSNVVSSTGRYVAFTSEGATLVPGDTNQVADVFVRDRTMAQTRRVSVGQNGAQANGPSGSPTLSGNGRYSAFASTATNLVTGDTNKTGDIFVHDWQTGVTSRVSVASNEAQANGSSGQPSISDDGRYVAFISGATNLVGPASTVGPLFVRDRQAGTTKLVTVTLDGGPPDDQSSSPAISGNGRFVAFISRASNLVAGTPRGFLRAYIRDLQTGTTTLASIGPSGAPINGYSVSLSADGRFVAFGAGSVYVRDRQLGITTLESVSSSGTIPTMSSDVPSISADGRYVAFTSHSDELLLDRNGVEDIFLRDRAAGTTTRVSVDSSGAETEFGAASLEPAISADGRTVVFTSKASNLTPQDLNDETDVFLHDVGPNKTVIRVNAGGPAFSDHLGRLWSADGGFNTGSTASHVVAIANTVDDALYQTERYDPVATPDLKYIFTVPNGTYLVRLHFAETAPANFAVGKKVFDVSLEGVKRFTNLDIFAQAGARAALIKSATTKVTDGTLNIAFTRKVQNPSICAIEVIQQ